jgi:hypothetical protein
VNTGDPETALYRRTTGTEDPNQAVPGVWQTHLGLTESPCGESRTAGSGSGPGKRAGRKTGTAPRTDFTTPSGRIDRCSCDRARNRLSPSRSTAGSGVDRSSVG